MYTFSNFEALFHNNGLFFFEKLYLSDVSSQRDELDLLFSASYEKVKKWILTR